MDIVLTVKNCCYKCATFFQEISKKHSYPCIDCGWLGGPSQKRTPAYRVGVWWVCKNCTDFEPTYCRDWSSILPGERGGRRPRGLPKFCTLRGRGDEKESILNEGV